MRAFGAILGLIAVVLFLPLILMCMCGWIVLLPVLIVGFLLLGGVCFLLCWLLIKLDPREREREARVKRMDAALAAKNAARQEAAHGH